MRIIIIGSGIIGVTSAYFLAKRGHKVTVIDRNDATCLECSFANASQLSYADILPWATKEIWRKIPELLFSYSSPLIFHYKLDLHMWKWLTSFMLACNDKTAYETIAKLVNLSLYSKKQMNEFLQDHEVEFDHGKKGIVHIFDRQADLDDMVDSSIYRTQFGLEFEEITKDKACELEPVLNFHKKDLIGGIHYPGEETGDTRKFALSLEEICKADYGVEFIYGVNFEEFVTENSHLKAIKTSQGLMEADQFLLASGAITSVYLRKIGVNLPIYPMKGYSITANYKDSDIKVQSSIMDHTYKIVYTRLGDRVRIAGTAELDGYNYNINPLRIEAITEAASHVLKDVFDPNNPHDFTKWSCLRPATPDGRPFLSKTHLNNLYINSGHGTLGWTLAMGSGSIIAQLMNNEPTDIDISSFAI